MYQFIQFRNIQIVRLGALILALSAIFPTKVFSQETSSTEEESVPAAPAAQATPTPTTTAATTTPAPSGQKKKKKTVQQGGDTYNFYFQKAPGPQKVQQGGSSGQTTETESEPEAKVDEKKEKKFEELATQPKSHYLDASLGLLLLPARGGLGVGASATLFPEKIIGARVSLFTSFKTTSNDSNFSAYGSEEDTSFAKMFGLDASVAFNLIRNDKFRISPLAGISFVHDSTTYRGYSFTAFGESNSQVTYSQSHLNPFVGLEGVFYINEHFGINASLSVPLQPKLTNALIGATLRI